MLIGFIIGALIAVPYGLAHSGGINEDERSGFWSGFGPMMSGHGMGMMGNSMMNGDMYEEMGKHMETGDFEGMQEEMEEHVGVEWEEMREMHESCEKFMGFEEDEEEGSS
ncbi:hypothetical protein [Thermococcus stetteri]|uniref:hypothetical protein n=1 Tax=Thermococcus stetteri TaxID=49900 RepID=UPI0031590A45|nr:hypothetical protein [Thermococcus stetteri]